RDLPGTPDVVFPGRRKAIQVHGCFWHQHEGCRRATLPATRKDYWEPKLERNKVRDREEEAALASLGWNLLIVWECELADMSDLATRIRSFLGPIGKPPRGAHQLNKLG
ncbi:MAG: very short patch repair endonuclease, partial [Chloroflexota bacterium]|nr:very short patch repair endonuclease [Chloroflexota bacterium]